MYLYKSAYIYTQKYIYIYIQEAYIYTRCIYIYICLLLLKILDVNCITPDDCLRWTNTPGTGKFNTSSSNRMHIYTYLYINIFYIYVQYINYVRSSYGHIFMCVSYQLFDYGILIGFFKPIHPIVLESSAMARRPCIFTSIG